MKNLRPQFTGKTSPVNFFSNKLNSMIIIFIAIGISLSPANVSAKKPNLKEDQKPAVSADGVQTFRKTKRLPLNLGFQRGR